MLDKQLSKKSIPNPNELSYESVSLAVEHSVGLIFIEFVDWVYLYIAQLHLFSFSSVEIRKD